MRARILGFFTVAALTACNGAATTGVVPQHQVSHNSGATSPALTRYTITDLGDGLPGGYTGIYPVAINSGGTVAGYTSPFQLNGYKARRRQIGALESFIYSNATFTVLGKLPGDLASIVDDLNDSGVAVGGSFNDVTGRAVEFVSGSVLDISGGSDVSEAEAISNSGIIVGGAGPDGVISRFSGGTVAPACGTATGYVTGVNDSGLIVGITPAPSGGAAAFQCPPFLAIGGADPAGVNAAFDVNSSSDVVGRHTLPSGLFDAFLYHGGVVSDLGTLDGAGIRSISAAFAINDSGTIVGFSATGTPEQPANPRAFVYSGGQMTDLNTLIPPNSGWSLVQANDINNSGQIVGTGNFKGNEHGYLLTPIP